MPGEHPQTTPPQSGRWVTVSIVSAGVFVLGVLLFPKLSFGPSLRLTTCFQDVSGLRRGARVRLAGVDVGTVREVRAQPTDKGCQGAVDMDLRTPYELRIPNDSVASTATAGILGETYLEIDVSGASGPPIQSGGQLPSKESEKFTPATFERALKELLKQRPEEEKNDKKEPPAKPAPGPTTK
jgi:ABC-type transporter Mla subunit MlaD